MTIKLRYSRIIYTSNVHYVISFKKMNYTKNPNYDTNKIINQVNCYAILELMTWLLFFLLYHYQQRFIHADVIQKLEALSFMTLSFIQSTNHCTEMISYNVLNTHSISCKSFNYPKIIYTISIINVTSHIHEFIIGSKRINVEIILSSCIVLAVLIGIP